MPSAARKAMIRARLRLALLTASEDMAVRSTEVERPHIFVCLAADYGNLGDLAITGAQMEFLIDAFPDAVVEAVPISRSLGAIKRLRRAIRPDDVVTLIGGGNTGDMYDDIQYLRELFVTQLRGAATVSFPQTVEFSETLYGRWAWRRAARKYGRHPRLSLLVRDSASAQRAAALAPGRTVTAPDVVLTLDRREPAVPREGVLLALRADLERGIDDSQAVAMRDAVAAVGAVNETDTHIGDVRLTAEEAAVILEEFWTRMRGARLVVTDRLHGMIFAVITGTPCLALDSGTGKVSQFYRDWLSGVPGVELAGADDPAEFRAAAWRLAHGTARPDPTLVTERFQSAFEEAMAGLAQGRS